MGSHKHKLLIISLASTHTALTPTILHIILMKITPIYLGDKEKKLMEIAVQGILVIKDLKFYYL